MKISKIEWVVIALTLFGAFIRLCSIGLQYTNFDEQFTQWWSHPSLSVWQIFWVSLTSDYTPPLHYLAVHLSQILFGVTSESIRYPSALAGTLTIPVAYFIGKEYKDELFGLLCAAFICTLYPMVYYSDFGRAFAFGILFIGIASYYFIRILKGDNRYLTSALFGLAGVLALWSHLYTAFPIFMMALVLLVLLLRRNYHTLPAILVLILGAAPLTNLLYAGFFGRGSAISAYGAKPHELLIIGPLDMYGFAALVLIPLIFWTVWKYRDDVVVRLLFVFSAGTFYITFCLLKVMAIVPHYLVYIPILLLIPTIIPFYNAVKEFREDKYPLYVTILIVTVLNFFQIGLFLTMQRLPAPM